MEVSNCPECKKALKQALLKGTDPSKLKMVDGHLPGCPTQKGDADAVRRPEADPQKDPQAAWPWAEGNFRIAPTPRPPADDAGPAQGSEHGTGGTGDRPTHHDPAGSAGRGTGGVQHPDRGPAPRRAGRAEPRGRQPVHGNGYAAAEAAAASRKQPVQQFKVVDHANKGEQRDHRKGAWFCAIVVVALLTVPVFPPIALLWIGMAIMLFVMR